VIRLFRIDRWVWYWFPDLKRLDTETERWQLWHAAYYPISRSPAYLGTAIVIQVAAQIILGVPADRYARSLGYYNGLIAGAIPLVIAIVAVLLTLWVTRRLITRNLRRRLNERGLPTCIPCGYDLTGNVSGICPECGSAWNSGSTHGNDTSENRRGTD
jgi:hypothetical protein